MVEKKSKIKKIAKRKAAKKKEKILPVKKEKYFEAVGRRKTSIARVRLYTKKSGVIVNEKDYLKYFSIPRLQKAVISPIEEMKIVDKVGAIVKVKGGGIKSQAEAIRLGIARVLILYNSNFRKRLREMGYLTRDARVVERKKYGLKKARRAPQWQKR
ncbi:30S ribosomal protein S9 [Candidatus Wolfebacteria bacterium CG03_land_8_20_14_0_80_36_15]|uniref:Small ribosomal subunit protein uS9 n=1 Tax=Candidatus Wolfebacteria bacterium CG03_land_8_20_14_0_80_36_15 TaxID=1975067 RepID=A0A2M7B8A0_9BACT|nr:MAG: 30S ribosomal protein S9 [Candidatus Wolfebacteria bacterium CG03_land_8_20_14_0_80_36_15]